MTKGGASIAARATVDEVQQSIFYNVPKKQELFLKIGTCLEDSLMRLFTNFQLQKKKVGKKIQKKSLKKKLEKKSLK